MGTEKGKSFEAVDPDREQRFCVGGGNEPVLEKEVAGDGGKELLDIEIEEVLDVEIPRAFSGASSRLGN